MADLAELDRADAVKIAGANPITGITDNYMQVDANGTAQVGLYDGSANAITSTTSGAKHALDVNIATALPAGANTIGAVTQASGPWTQNLTQVSGTAISLGQTLMATSLPVVIASDQSAIPISFPLDISPATQNITTQDIASTTNSGANGQSIITGTATAASTASFALTSDEGLSIQVSGTWTGTLQAEISMDGGTTWYVRLIHQAGTLYTPTTFTANLSGVVNIAGCTNFRIRAIAAMTGTATIKVVETDNLNSIYVANDLKIVDNSGNITEVSANSDLFVRDVIDNAGQYRAQSVTTTAAEATGAASRLTNRKYISLRPTNGTIYWGFTSGVTTSSGTPIFKNEFFCQAFTDLVPIYVISSGTVDCRVTEGS